MEKSAARTLRLLTLLQSHRQWPGGELARRLGITTRTLRRQIDGLRELGYEIASTPGAGGGYRLTAGNRMPPLLLTDEESVAVAVGLRIVATTGIADAESTTLSALAKFEQVLPPALRERVNAIGLSVEPQAPRGGFVSSELLGALALACRDHERIRFRYTAADGAETRRLVEPHSLVAADRKWFLVSWDLDRDDWRTFRVDRVEELVGTGVRAEKRVLPAEDAAEFVAVAAGSVLTRHTARAILDMPLDEMRAHFGPWAQNAHAVDDVRTSWPFGGDSFPILTTALSWIPEGVAYEVDADEDYLLFLREQAVRMLTAVETSLNRRREPAADTGDGLRASGDQGS